MNKLKTLLTGLIILTIFYLVMLSMTYNSFDANGFNMTSELINESRMLELCIEWKIENETCSMIYGSINNDNGEPDLK